MLNRNHLALFLAVAEEGGFGRAARRLRISQPAVSMQIAQLEEMIGAALFERFGRNIRLTDAGERLAQYASRIAVLEAEAAKAMEELAAVRTGRLRLGASTTIAAYLLPELMRDFRAKHPDIVLDMQIGNSARVQQMLMDGAIDVGLVEGLEQPQGMEMQVFREDQLVPIVHWDHPLLKLKKARLRDFMKHPIILREPGSGTRETTLAFFTERGHTVTPEYAFGTTEAIKGAVAAGLGVSYVSSLTIAGDVLLKRLAVLSLADAKPIGRPLHILQVPGRSLSPAATAFMAILKKR